MRMLYFVLNIANKTARPSDLGQNIHDEPVWKDHAGQSRGGRETGWTRNSEGESCTCNYPDTLHALNNYI